MSTPTRGTRYIGVDLRLGSLPLSLRQGFRLISLGLVFALALLHMWVVQETQHVALAPHLPPPHKQVAHPPKRNASFETNDFDGRKATCFENFAHTSQRPWDKCKRTFVSPNVTLISPPKDDINLGDEMHYRIESNLPKGSKDCISGGNFWYAVLMSHENPRASCVGSIVDHCNGSYDLYAIAAWAGNATLDLTLVHSGEAVNHLRNVVWPAEGRVAFTGYYKNLANYTGSYKQMPHTVCYFRSHGNLSGYCAYPHQRAMGNTTLVCGKIHGIPCESLHTMNSHGAKIAGSTRTLTKNVEYMFISPNYWTPVQSPDANLTIKGAGQVLQKDLPRCYPDQPIPAFKGYWKDGVWYSLLCAINTDWTEQSRLRMCIANKHLILLGDSTTRQWFQLLRSLIGIKVTKPPDDVYCCTMHRDYSTLNTTMRFRIHPHVLASYAVAMEDVKFEVDELDGLDDPACNYIVVVSPWAHFPQWTRDSYIERTKLLRDAVLRLRKRCPEVPVVLKGPHPRQHRNFASIIYSSDYLLQQIGLINRETFRGIGVWFLPVWDINLAYPSENIVHMPSEVVKEELKIFLAFVCDSHQ